jgi:hypothetical protein
MYIGFLWYKVPVLAPSKSINDDRLGMDSICAHPRRQFFGSGSVSGSRTARIRIDFDQLDPDPGGQNNPTKIEKVKKFHVLKCWMSLLRR